MRSLLILAIGLLLVSQGSEAYAKPRRSYNNTYNTNRPTNYTYTSNVVSNNDTSTAQGVAEIMARNGRVGHWGGNSGYEGCGSGFSPEEAYRNCCFANSGMTTVDVGYAQSPSGRWFCCRRYR